MNANLWSLICFVVFLQTLVISSVKSSKAGSCFSSAFSRSIGYVLHGFLLGEMKVPNEIECKRRCVINANCLSVNILKNSDGSFMCQLNSGLKKDGAREQFVQHGAGDYYGLKEKRICENNGKTCDTAAGSWYAFNQSYFQFVNTPLAYEEARKICLEMKGDLASPSSEEEQTFLFKTFMETNPQSGGNVYIGLNDIAVEGVFIWTDGSPVTHARWKEGEPDNYNNEEDCAVITELEDGSYGDKPCNKAYKFICETNYETLYG